MNDPASDTTRTQVTEGECNARIGPPTAAMGLVVLVVVIVVVVLVV